VSWLRRLPKAKLINLLQLPGGNGSQRCCCRCASPRCRKAVSELACRFFRAPQDARRGRRTTTTVRLCLADWESDGATTVLSDLNIFLFSSQLDIGVVIKALESKGSVDTSPTEPDRVQRPEGELLGGGELPVPMVQGNSGQVY
jgi:hypothetical protein